MSYIYYIYMVSSRANTQRISTSSYCTYILVALCMQSFSLLHVRKLYTLTHKLNGGILAHILYLPRLNIHAMCRLWSIRAHAS